MAVYLANKVLFMLRGQWAGILAQTKDIKTAERNIYAKNNIIPKTDRLILTGTCF